MEADEHIRLAREFIADAVWLEARGNHRLAAEGIWGAALYAIAAGRHRRGMRHGNIREMASFAAAIAADNPRMPETGWQAVKDKLHNHFYTNRLSAEEAARRLAMGREFAAGLLQAAERGEQAGAR